MRKGRCIYCRVGVPVRPGALCAKCWRTWTKEAPRRRNPGTPVRGDLQNANFL